MPVIAAKRKPRVGSGQAHARGNRRVLPQPRNALPLPGRAHILAEAKNRRARGAPPPQGAIMPELRQNIVDDLTSVTTESWRTFRIMAEMVTALDQLNALKSNCISIFGSARCTPDMQEYQDAEKIAHMLVQAGFGIITGGGPGIMEAANKGASEAGGESVGLHIHLPHEQGCNKYVKTRCNFRYFFIRKFMFVKYAMAYVVMPGGMGTIDELSEAFVLAQTGRTRPFPIILYDSRYWSGFLEWLRNSMVAGGFIQEAEIQKLVTVCDTPEEVVNHLCKIIIL